MAFRFEEDDKPHILLTGDDDVIAFRFTDPERGEQRVNEIELDYLPWEAYTDAKNFHWFELVEELVEHPDPDDPTHLHISGCIGYATIRLLDSDETMRVVVHDVYAEPSVPATAAA